MKVFDSIMSGKLDNYSSSFMNSLRDEDEPDLKQILIEESC